MKSFGEFWCVFVLGVFLVCMCIVCILVCRCIGRPFGVSVYCLHYGVSLGLACLGGGDRSGPGTGHGTTPCGVGDRQDPGTFSFVLKGRFYERKLTKLAQNRSTRRARPAKSEI